MKTKNRFGGVGRVLLMATLLIGLMGTVSADQQIIDDFNDGDLSEYDLTDTQATDTVEVVTSPVLEGSHALHMSTDQGNNPDYGSSSTSGNLNKYPSRGENFTFYTRYTNDDMKNFFFWFAHDNSGASPTNGYLICLEQQQATCGTDEFGIGKRVSGNAQKIQGTDFDTSNYYDEWLKVKVDFGNTESDTIKAYLYDSNDNLIASTQAVDTFRDSGGITWTVNSASGPTEGWFDYAFEGPENTKPSIDSVSTNPSSWTLGSSVNVSADVSDSDGTVSGVSADVYEDGTQIVSDASLTENSGTWEVDNLFTVDESDVYYNLTLTATDDDGATATYETSQFIQDLPPAVTIQDPVNSTYWSYDVPYQVDVDNNNDNIPGQSFSCDFSSNGTVFRSVSGSGVDSFSGNFSQDLGQNIEFQASCSDTGGTSNKSVNFSVEDFQVSSVYSDSPVYETENITYESEIYQGEMIESVNYSLIWDGEEVNQASQSLSDQGSMIQDLDHTIPLVSSNNTQKNWKWNFTVERTEINGNTSSVTYSSSDQSQDVFWSYYISDSTALYDQESSSQVKILEGQDAGQRVNVSRETTSASLSGKMNFTRTDAYLDMDKEEISDSLVQFEASELSDKISSSSRTDDVFSNITVSFQGDSRKISTSDTVETHQIQFSQGAGTDALQFEVIQENDFSNTLTSDIDIAVEYWAENSSQRVTRTFSTASEGKTTHTFEISPSWAEIVVDSSEKLIQYQDSTENYRLRSYFLLEETVSSDLTEIDLYALKKDVSSRIGIETVDSDGSTIPEVIVRAERYFPAEDKALSVVMARTGSDGRTESFFEVNEIYYGFKFYRRDDSGSYELVSEEPQQIISQDLLRFTVSDVEQIGYYDFKEGIGSSCEYNATQVRCSYTSEEAVQEVVLNVEEERPLQWENVCSQTASSASATLICDGLNASDADFSYSLEATSGDGDTITLETGRSGEGGQDFGDAGLIISFFLFVTLGLGSVAGPRPIPEISVLLSTVAVVASYSVGLLAITYQAAATFVILGAITIYKMRNEGGGIGL